MGMYLSNVCVVYVENYLWMYVIMPLDGPMIGVIKNNISCS